MNEKTHSVRFSRRCSIGGGGGCAQKTSAPKPLLELKYNASQSRAASNVDVAVVKPRYSQYTAPVQTRAESFVSAINALKGTNSRNGNIKEIFSSDYAPQVENSLFNDLAVIAKSKGLRVVATAINEDELTYAQKKDVELILRTEFDITPSTRVTKAFNCQSYPIVGIQCTDEEGYLTLTGKVYINFIEPLSKEKILIKTIDITSIDNSKALNQIAYKGADQAEAAMVHMLNAVYPNVMARVEKLIDPDEIRAALADVNRLKEKLK